MCASVVCLLSRQKKAYDVRISDWSSDVCSSDLTEYNTLEFLVSCDLVKKHQFGKNMAQFEKSYGFKQHDHVICIECSKVVEFCDPHIHQLQSMIGELLNFDIKHHSLNLYGICSACASIRKKDRKSVV